MQVPRLRDARIRAFLTQVELAERAGVAEPTVVAAEKGKKIRISTVRKLAEALGIGPQDLVALSPPPVRGDES